MTKAEAKKLSIKKWKWIVKMGAGYCYDELIKKYPELSKFQTGCAYCHLYNDTISERGDKACMKCPLRKIEKGCMQEDSPWKKWYWHTTKKNAQTMLGAIRRT